MINIILPITVVIPTLGGNHLTNTISKLNEGEFIPSEILICIPKSHIKNNDFVLSKNSRILATPEKGQVAQRAFGFKNSSNNFVLQLDDDVELPNNGLKKMFDKLVNLGKQCVVAPIWVDSLTNNAIHNYKTGFRSFIENIIVYIILGAPWGIKRMGVISKSGVNYGVDMKFMKFEFLNVDWVPGGCVLYHKEDLFCENYYPFNGKAYSEDLIHSYILRKKGVKLYVLRDVIALTPIPKSSYNESEFNLKYNALKYFNLLQRGSMIRLYLWNLISKFRKA